MFKAIIFLLILVSNIFAMSKEEDFYLTMNALANSKTEYDLRDEKVAFWYLSTFESEEYNKTIGDRFAKFELFEKLQG